MKIREGERGGKGGGMAERGGEKERREGREGGLRRRRALDETRRDDVDVGSGWAGGEEEGH